MAKCYICGCEIDTEITKPEHIIPNGIGGKLKTKTILCNTHNNELSVIDELICQALESHTNRLNPSRDNGTNPTTLYEMLSGEKVVVYPTGEFHSKNPKIDVKELENGITIIQYSTYYSDGSKHKDFAINQIKSIVAGKARKNGLPEDEIAKRLIEVEKLFEENIKTDFNPILKFKVEFDKSDRLFLGLAKIALDYYFYNDLPKEDVQEYLNKFIQEDLDFIYKNSNYFYEDDFSQTESIYHSLILKGDKNNKLLYCLISLYGVLKCVILLNNNYDGNDIYKSYSYDLRNKEVINFQYNPTITQDRMISILESKCKPEDFIKAQDNFMSFFKYGNDKETKEDLNIFAQKIQEEIKILQSKPIINSPAEFKKIIEEICEKHAKENTTLKQLAKHELQGLYEKISQITNYELYLQPYVLQLTTDIFIKALTEIAVSTPQILEDEEVLINNVFDFYLDVKTTNETINTMLNNNQSNVKEFIAAFLPTIKPQLNFIRNYTNK